MVNLLLPPPPPPPPPPPTTTTPPPSSSSSSSSMIDVLMSAFGQFHIAGPLKRALGLVGLNK